MRTDFPAGLVTDLEKVVTDPVVLVELGFSPVVYYSSREQITYDTHTWIAANIRAQIGDAANVSIFNEGLVFGSIVLAQGTVGRYIKIYVYYNGNAALAFSGEMSAATIGDIVNITCKKRPPNRSPRFYAVPPTCNYTPKAGMRIATGRGNVIVLESK